MVAAKNASSNADEYEDGRSVQSYLEQFWPWYMTEFEKGCYTLGMRRAKAEANPDLEWSKRVIAEWEKITDTEQRAVLAQGFYSFQERVRRRIWDEFHAGVLHVNRCPQCHRVVRTPSAQQCFWCGHDWHG
jgi:hypothetical protein